MMNKKLKAFTIMEITVAMLIAAIAIGITYTCYTIIVKSYAQFKTRQGGLIELSLLRQVLSRDMSRGELILVNAQNIRIKNTGDDIIYTIRDSTLLRMAARTDTFKIKVSGMKAYFEHQLISSDSNSNTAVLADQLAIQILSGRDTVPFIFTKSYSAENLFNAKPYANN